MDYEKKYKEALERAKKLHKDAITLQLEQDIKDYEYIFPELKEREDEQHRKWILEYFLDRLTTVEQEFLWEHIEKVKKVDREEREQNPAWSEEVQEEQVSEEFINALGTMLNDGLPDRYLVSEERIKKSAELLFSIARKQLKNEMQEWSEEDEYTLYETIRHLEELIRIDKAKHLGCYVQYYQRDIDWLKSLKDRVLPQPKQEWSEEDKCMLNNVIGTLKPLSQTTHSGYAINSMINWLKSLKDRVQPEQEWSEEEIEKAAQEWDSKANFNPFYMTMDGDKPTGVKQDITTHKESFKAGVNWILKSLRPQNHWQPSNKQMEVLLSEVTAWTKGCSKQIVLESLYDDLKKLKGE